MARARRTWGPSDQPGTLSYGILRILGEEANRTVFEPETLLELFNQEMDLRALELLEAHEGFSRWVWREDLQKNKRFYELPSGMGRPLEVRVKNSGVFVPVYRAERLFTATTEPGDATVPTCRLMKGRLELDPPPTITTTKGLEVTGEDLWPRLEDDGDALPESWPVLSETLLQLDTALAALGVEEAMDDTPDGIMYLLRRRSRYERRWLEYIETWLQSPQFAVRYAQGG